MPFKIELLGVKEIEAKLNKLPIEVADKALGEVQDYMLDVMKNDQPPEVYVSRKAAYGQSFSSDAQRRWYWAAVGRGELVPGEHKKRTGKMRAGWHKVRSGLTGYIENRVKGAAYVYGDTSQANQPALVGWKKVIQQVMDREAKINKIIDGEARKAIRKLGLQ
jgi:hypothetical protein